MRISTELLLAAYCQGLFPMAYEDGAIYWYDPDPRAILPLNAFHIPRRLERWIRNTPFDIRVDTAFTDVIYACAELKPGRESTWLNEEIIQAYIRLHQKGFAHSVEVWQKGKLVGGLYGVAIGGLFAGESMFSRSANASKVALVYLVSRLRESGYQLLDLQFMSEHLRRFGAIEISSAEYKRRLALTLNTPAHFQIEAGEHVRSDSHFHRTGGEFVRPLDYDEGCEDAKIT